MKVPEILDWLINWPARMNPAARWVFMVSLLGIILAAGWVDLNVRIVFSWDVARHWLTVWGVVTAAVTLGLAVLSVLIFALNPDWHTSAGWGNLLGCLVAEALVVAGLTGGFVLVKALIQMAR